MSTDDNDTEAMRAFTRALFAPDPDDDRNPAPEHEPERGNVVPREGNTPHVPERDMAAFVRNLFDRANRD